MKNGKKVVKKEKPKGKSNDAPSAVHPSADSNFDASSKSQQSNTIVSHITSTVNEIRDIFKYCNTHRLDACEKALTFAGAFITAIVLWKLLMLQRDAASPVVVVLSGSMEPAFYRGDLLVLSNTQELKIGDVAVFQVKGRDIPIVHRIVSFHSNETDTYVLTKGDNNNVDDRGLYADNQLWLSTKDIIGQATVIIPCIGTATIFLNDNPVFKYSILAISFLLMVRNG